MVGRHNKSVSDISPGPGQYQPDYSSKLKRVTYGYSMVGRGESASSRTANPGPGSYNIDVKKSKKMGKFGRQRSRSMVVPHSGESPGPGSYTLKDSSSRHTSAPNYTFASKHQNLQLNAAGKTPGPGSYNIKPKFGNEGAKHFIVPRRAMSSKTIGRTEPGPGAYTPYLNKTGPKYKIGTAPKCALIKELVRVPGPGAYSPDDKAGSNKQNSPHWKMGSAKKCAGGITERTPGPGSYNHKEEIGEGPKYAMRPKTASTIIGAGPGPGQYNPKSDKKRPPSAVIGKETRGVDFSTSKHVPGPGAYMHSRELTSKPAHEFGRDKKLKYGSEITPGPGYYKVPCTFADVPNYLIPNKSTEFAYV